MGLFNIIAILITLSALFGYVKFIDFYVQCFSKQQKTEHTYHQCLMKIHVLYQSHPILFNPQTQTSQNYQNK